MSKAQQIRDAVAAGKLTLSELMEKTGLQGRGKVESICLYLQNKGEITIDRSGDEPVIAKAAAKRKANKRPKKSRSHKKPRKARRTKTLRQIVERVAQRPALGQLAIAQLIAASRLLRTTIREQVDGLDNNPLLTGALQNAERDEALAEAA